MAGNGDSPEEAVDAYLDAIRAILGCILNCTTLGSGDAEGVEHTLILFARGQTAPNMASLRTHGGVGELLLFVRQLYTVARTPNSTERGSFNVKPSFYQYLILDRDQNEIVVYDWAPTGPSPFRTPHLHVPAAGSIVLKQRPGSPLEHQKTFLSSLHFPTAHISLEDIVELLIREFQVVPRRDDWEEVLAANREAVGIAGPR